MGFPDSVSHLPGPDCPVLSHSLQLCRISRTALNVVKVKYSRAYYLAREYGLNVALAWDTLGDLEARTHLHLLKASAFGEQWN